MGLREVPLPSQRLDVLHRDGGLVESRCLNGRVPLWISYHEVLGIVQYRTAALSSLLSATQHSSIDLLGEAEVIIVGVGFCMSTSMSMRKEGLTIAIE